MISQSPSTLALGILLLSALGAAPASASLINVAAPGNLLAGLPSADLNASSETSYGPAASQMVDNFVNTPNQDNGQVFADGDANQRIAVTGFDSSIGRLRFYSSSSDPVRYPSTLTVYYSTLSTTSINETSSAYTGSNGGILLATISLASIVLTPVSGATAGYVDFSVNAPAGTQTLLLDIGSAHG